MNEEKEKEKVRQALRIILGQGQHLCNSERLDFMGWCYGSVDLETLQDKAIEVLTAAISNQG